MMSYISLFIFIYSVQITLIMPIQFSESLPQNFPVIYYPRYYKCHFFENECANLFLTFCALPFDAIAILMYLIMQFLFLVMLVIFIPIMFIFELFMGPEAENQNREPFVSYV